MYAPDQTIHDTLNHAGAPVRQRATAADSVAALQEYVYRTILSTPVSAEENGVDKGAGVYYPDIFHRLPQDTYHSVLLKLQRVFILDSTSVATWSRQVSAPPKPPLGTLLRVTGGVGKGQVWSQSSHCCLTVQWSGCTPLCVLVSQEQDVIAIAARLELSLMRLSFQVATIKTALINNAGKELFAALFTYSLTTQLPMRMVSV